MINFRLTHYLLLFIATAVTYAEFFPFVEFTDEVERTRVIGTEEHTWKGESYAAFRGIPYAEEPIGELRFKDPQQLRRLPASIEAIYAGHDCPSIYATNASESCLNLNVYSSYMQLGSPLPVVVFIHPGGLYLGSGLNSFIGPELLLTKEIVLVTFNYRLGTLGFLNVGTAELPGNAGFKDQVAALKWVQKYIKYFGGNGGDVTLMGYSAGALSVSLHLVSPMSKGLFHKAVIMSGAVPPQTKLPCGDQSFLVERQVKLLNSTVEEAVSKKNIKLSTKDLLDILSAYNGTQIADTLRGMFDFGKDNPIYLWLPIIETDFNQTRFLTEDFYTALRAGRFQRVPLLVGYTNGEFCTSAADILKNTDLTGRFYANFEKLAPKIFMYEGHANSNRITATLKRHYLVENSVWLADFKRICDLYSDAIIRFGAHRLSTLVAQHGVPVYNYQFAYRGVYGNLDFLGGLEGARAEHMDDLMYLFRMQPHHFVQDDEDAEAVDLYVNFIYDFIRNGSLTADVPTNFPQSYALITDRIAYVNGTNFREADFWERLLP